MSSEHLKEFDLHGHTTSGSEGSRFWRRLDWTDMSPEKVVQEAKRAGLDGVAITDHDSIRGLDRALNAGAKYGVIVVPGAEITAHDGPTFPHILALGLNPEYLLSDKGLPTLQDPETVIKWIHDQGALAIATHPSAHGGATRANLRYNSLRKLAPLFDAIQTINIEQGHNQGAEVIALEYEKPQVGASDFHLLGQVGIARTRVFKDVNDWSELLVAIKEGRTEPFFRQDIPDTKEFKRAAIGMKRLGSLLI